MLGFCLLCGGPGETFKFPFGAGGGEEGAGKVDVGVVVGVCGVGGGRHCVGVLFD